MRKLSLTIIFLCFSVNASAQFGGSFIPEGPNSTYQIFSNTNKFVGILDASDITVQQALEDLSFIVASPTTVTSEWNFANGNLVLPQGTTCPNAGSCTDGAICYDTNATSGQRVYACESGTWTLQGDGGAGGGDSVTVNSTAASDVQFNESLPSIPASGLGVKWQINTSTSPDSVSAYAAVNTSSVLAGVLSDETGSGGGVVFATSPTITSPTISTSIALPASAVDAITEIASALKSGADTTLVTGTSGTNGNCAQWNVDGDIVDSGAGCGGGSGDSILVNGSAVTDANFNESNPSTPASGLSVKWQTTGSSATQITGYAAVSTSAILAGVLSDETGSSGGVVVFSSTPTIVTPTINDGVATITPPENDNSTKLATTAYVQTELSNGVVKSFNLPIYSAKLTGAFVVFTPPTADACTQGAQIDAGDGNWRLLFDATTDECATWQFIMPSNYASAPLLDVMFSMASGEANEVEFEAAVMCYTPTTDTADIGTASFSNVAVGTATTVSATAGEAYLQTITLTDDSCAAGDIVFIVLSTDANDATNDDSTGDREVVGVNLRYTGL